MKIALFHNLPTGGAKRALWEHARELHARGHVLDAYVMDTAAEDFLPLTPFCHRVEIVPAPACARRQARTGGWGGPVGAKLRSALDTNHQIHLMDEWARTYRTLAARMDDDGYEAAYVHHCRFASSPALLQFLKTPSLYFCQDTLRHAHEWAIETTPGYDDAPGAGWGRRKVRGQVFSLPAARVLAEQEKRDARSARAATRVLANSWYSREAIVRAYGISACVCYLGVDSDFFSPDPAIAREPDVVLSVGSITLAKRHDFVIEAIATIPPSRRPRLRILGYDPQRARDGTPGPVAAALAQQAETHDVRLEISHGSADDVLRDAYRRAGVVAFAPHLEPFGFISLEAMACQTPIVGVSEGGLRETIQNEQTGLLTDRDPAAFGTALDRVLSDETFAARLGAAGQTAVLRDWTWARSADALERHLRAISAPAKPPMV